MLNDVRVSFTDTGTPGRALHQGFVAGVYRDGALSDIWTDVTRCARGTFIRLVAACDCGWRGTDQPVTFTGFKECQRAWVSDHLGHIHDAGTRGRFATRAPSSHPLDIRRAL